MRRVLTSCVEICREEAAAGADVLSTLFSSGTRKGGDTRRWCLGHFNIWFPWATLPWQLLLLMSQLAAGRLQTQPWLQSPRDQSCWPGKVLEDVLLWPSLCPFVPPTEPWCECCLHNKQGPTRKTQQVLNSSSGSHCDNSGSTVAEEIVVGWPLSFGVAPTYFQMYCNYRKFSVYVYTLAQSTGPRSYQLIFMAGFIFLWYVSQSVPFHGTLCGSRHAVTLCPVSLIATTATTVLLCD